MHRAYYPIFIIGLRNFETNKQHYAVQISQNISLSVVGRL